MISDEEEPEVADDLEMKYDRVSPSSFIFGRFCSLFGADVLLLLLLASDDDGDDDDRHRCCK